jgi:GNAT superfamily N-acetyltransferase
MRRDGKPSKSKFLTAIKVINAYRGRKLAGSIVFEIYSIADNFPNVSGPFFNNDTSNGVILAHTLYVVPNFRGTGIMKRLLHEMAIEKLPVYASFVNSSLEEYFLENFKPCK